MRATGRWPSSTSARCRSSRRWPTGRRTYAYAQHEGSEYATVGDNDAKLVA